jgi:antitoxin CptB
MLNQSKMTAEEVRRLSWRCRRGLLELDIVLQAFSARFLQNLTASELIAFDCLLDLPDNEFLDILTNRTVFIGDKGEEGMPTLLAKLRTHSH